MVNFPLTFASEIDRNWFWRTNRTPPVDLSFGNQSIALVAFFDLG